MQGYTAWHVDGRVSLDILLCGFLARGVGGIASDRLSPLPAETNLLGQMLWELRAEPLPGSPESVLVEMRQVPGYLDFLAEIMPPDVRL